MDLITIRQLSVSRRIADINLNLVPGEMLGVLGANGAGKSTLLQCLGGVLPYRGEILLTARLLRQMPGRDQARQIGLLPQSSQSAWALTVEDVITLGRLPWGDNDQEAVRQAAADTQVSDWMQRQVDQLSGGQQARVWLARVLAGKPTVLLADAHVASLDQYHQQYILTLLRRYARNNRGVILSIHDLSLAARYCDRLCLLHQGRVLAAGTPAEVLTQDHLRTAFHIDAHIDLESQPPIIVPK